MGEAELIAMMRDTWGCCRRDRLLAFFAAWRPRAASGRSRMPLSRLVLAAPALIAATQPVVALQSRGSAEPQIRAQRAAFNRALAAGDVRGIAPVLADNAQLVT